MSFKRIGTLLLGFTIATPMVPAFAGGAAMGASMGAAHVASPVQRLDFAAVKRQLRRAKGVGFITKLKLANRVNRLTEDFYWFHNGKTGRSLADMRARFVALHSHIAVILRADNPNLSASLIGSRESLWRAFADRRLFASGVGLAVKKRIEAPAPQIADTQLR